MKANIGTKLGFSFGIVIALMITSALLVYKKVQDLDESGKRVLERAIPTLESCYAIRNATNRSSAALREYLIFAHNPDEAAEAVKQRFESWREIEEELRRLEQLASTKSLEQANADLAPLAIALNTLRSAQNSLESRSAKKEETTVLNDALEHEVNPQREAVRVQLGLLQSSTDSLLSRSRDQMVSAVDATGSTLVISSVLGVVFAGIVATVFSRRIAARLKQVVVASQRIAAGDLTGKALSVDTGDEIGDLAAAFNTMRDGLTDLARQILEATENVTSSAAEIAASTKQQAAASKEQAASIQQITSTMREITESGAQIEDRARSVSTDAEATCSASASGTDAAQEVNRSMEGIREQVEQVAENIVSLSGRTQAIGELIATVTDIAEQSNLLALNASIEAVSAGEQGGRFSVVANEMKNLADQAKECTVQVRTILGEIQKGIHSSVMLTEEAVKRVEKGKAQTDTTERTIVQLADTTVGCVQAFQQIVGGTNQQQIGLTQINQGMDGIRQAVAQTATGTSQLEKAASNLSALSHQLQSAVRRYQI